MSLPNLAPEHFADFFRAVHGYAPFLWQARLAAEVLAHGRWPEVVSLPTSAGKTSLIDIAVFALACEAEKPAAERRTALRIFFVIDRRVVADEAFDRAEKIAAALLTATKSAGTDAVLKAVECRLSHLAENEKAPLHVALMRGGIALDDEWIRSPLQPTVCVSTVDQVGSRLLFRGYGVAPRQRSMHAALTAHDSLLIVDEAHISVPFCTTLRAVQKLASRSEEAVIRPLHLVEMTATTTPGVEPFTLLPAEAEEPELKRRIVKPKPTKLEDVAAGEDEQNQPALVNKAVSMAHEWAGKRARVIGIVVNRVMTARRIFAALDAKLGEKALFIGRIRPLDRDRLWEKWRARLASASAKDRQTERSIFVVATQTIEVGADLDFDALISELAPIDSLRQRFGRLNRRGREIAVEATVLATKEQIGARYKDPVYAETLAPTWKWLQGQQDGKGKNKVVDFSYTNIKTRLEATADEVRDKMRVQPDRTPLLHPPFVDAWACTAAPLMHDPEIAPFLHGDQKPRREVQIIWRADLDELLFTRAAHRDHDFKERLEAARELLRVLPPSSREALPIAHHSAVRWLQDLFTLELTDTPDASDREPDRHRLLGRHALVWRNAEDIEMAWKPEHIRAGDVLIVPSSCGGADEFGWIGSTAKSAPVADLAEEAAWKAERAPFIRLHRAVLAQHGVVAPRGLFEAVANEEFSKQRKEWIAALATQSDLPGVDPEWRNRVLGFAKLKFEEINLPKVPIKYGAILRSRLAIDPMTLLWADDGHDEASQTVEVPLEKHLANVTLRAVAFAQSAGLPKPLIETIRVAAELHDIGKADPRTQVLFHGSEARAFAEVKAGRLLAKSNHRFANGAAYRRLYHIAGLPLGARHETLSVALAEAEETHLAKAANPDAALHLIAAHHGYARPFLKPLESSDDEPDTVDLSPLGVNYTGAASYAAAALSGGVAERFLTLQQRFGWWGLAWLETLLRLADWAQSAAEQPRFPKSA